MSDLRFQQEHGITIAKRQTSEQLLSSDSPYARLLLDVMKSAKQRGASDIHFEPNEFGIAVRFRIDGTLVLDKQIGLEHRDSLILETKRIFGLAIGISGRPQDGRASLSKMRLDLRVSLLPTYFGEKIVMRLLNLDANFELSALGFMAHELNVLERSTRFEDGVIVVSGPTGSGKTRTLYALLKAIDPKRFNIVTLEDPIEYRVEGLNQVQVNRKMTFADALRSVLRQDPDVILVGEVRDRETAKLCFEASETGHLVLTTLHANGAIEVIERLAGLGIERLVLESNLRLSIAQRLEQKVCLRCAKRAARDVHEWFQAMDHRDSPTRLERLRQRNEQGCSFCCFGIHGRVPVLEWASFELDANVGRKMSRIHQTIQCARILRALNGEIDAREVSHGNP